MNFGARNRLASVIGESDAEVLVSEKGGMHIIRAKGSHKSCIVCFDWAGLLLYHLCMIAEDDKKNKFLEVVDGSYFGYFVLFGSVSEF